MRCGRGFSRRDALKRHEKALIDGKKVHCVPLAQISPEHSQISPESLGYL